MKSKILGRTGIEVPVLGIGTGFLGKDPKTADVDQNQGIQTILAALDAGCTWIDTAPLYGGTQSETIIGKALTEYGEKAEQVTVTTKVGATRAGLDYSYDAVMRSVEASQKRLGRGTFEILYIHDAMAVPMERVMGKGCALEALRTLQDQGIVRFLGTATNDPIYNAPFIETGEFDVALVPDAWSLINQQADRLIFPAAEKHKVGIVLATAIERGLLATGPSETAHHLNRRFSSELLSHVGKIKALCDNAGIPLLAVALQWCIRHPQVALTLVGPQNPVEARQNYAAVEFNIPESFWAELEPWISDWSDTGYLVSPSI